MKLIQPRLNYKLSLKDYLIAFTALFSNKKKKSEYLNKLFDSDKLFFFAHARSALQIALLTLPKNSKVGVQPFTCHTVLEAIENANCKVVFIDINDQLVIDVENLKLRLPEIDALIVTHTFGFPVNVKEIKSLLKDKLLIEDCAHAFLSRYNNEIVGKLGDFAIFSYGFAKFPSAVQGGWLLVNNNKYDIELKYKSILNPGILYEIKVFLNSIVFPFLNSRFFYTLITQKLKNRRNKIRNYTKELSLVDQIKKSPGTGLAIFENQLNKIGSSLSSQKINGSMILKELKKNSNFSICQNVEGMNFFMIPVKVDNPDHFIAYAKDKGIEIGKHFVQSKYIISSFGYSNNDCENYENIIDKIVTLPCHYNYPKKHIQELQQIIRLYKSK